MMKRVTYLGLRLVLVCLVAATCLGLTYAVTRDKIAEQKKTEETEACVDALPGLEDAGELEEDPQLEKKVKEHVPDVEKVFECSLGDIIIVKVKGYGGPIRMAVGIGPEGSVKGLSVISHSETPGLGANIENEEFLRQFEGKTAKDPIRVKEDIQAITGATITSKAAAKEVREAIEAYQGIHKN